MSTTPMPRTTLRHRLPIRKDFDLEVELPRDLTSKEAVRISEWLKTLVIDQKFPPLDVEEG